MAEQGTEIQKLATGFPGNLYVKALSEGAREKALGLVLREPELLLHHFVDYVLSLKGAGIPFEPRLFHILIQYGHDKRAMQYAHQYSLRPGNSDHAGYYRQSAPLSAESFSVLLAHGHAEYAVRYLELFGQVEYAKYVRQLSAHYEVILKRACPGELRAFLKTIKEFIQIEEIAEILVRYFCRRFSKERYSMVDKVRDYLRKNIGSMSEAEIVIYLTEWGCQQCREEILQETSEFETLFHHGNLSILNFLRDVNRPDLRERFERERELFYENMRRRIEMYIREGRYQNAYVYREYLIQCGAGKMAGDLSRVEVFDEVVGNRSDFTTNRNLLGPYMMAELVGAPGWIEEMEYQEDVYAELEMTNHDLARYYAKDRRRYDLVTYWEQKYGDGDQPASYSTNTRESKTTQRRREGARARSRSTTRTGSSQAYHGIRRRDSEHKLQGNIQSRLILTLRQIEPIIRAKREEVDREMDERRQIAESRIDYARRLHVSQRLDLERIVLYILGEGNIYTKAQIDELVRRPRTQAASAPAT